MFPSQEQSIKTLEIGVFPNTWLDTCHHNCFIQVIQHYSNTGLYDIDNIRHKRWHTVCVKNNIAIMVEAFMW